MAIFGKLETVQEQVKNDKFEIAFQYLKNVLNEVSAEHQRLTSLPIDTFKKIDLDSNNFALEQVYYSKNRKDCFFESHEQYIDVQFILDGEEIIELIDKNELEINTPYNKEMDLIKYNDKQNNTLIKLQKGDIAIFYPNDAHMPCVEVEKAIKVVKTVIKVKA